MRGQACSTHYAQRGLSYAAVAHSFHVSRPTLYRALERAEKG
ncbi:helix-turn-helix domain-containing protein [Corynebacterium glucuronolyticum]|nr:helix-turn-helix domain-containing protein [Corynebacterium glucuronolyticum]